MPAGAKVLPLRSNIPEISKFTFYQLDESYYERAMQLKGGASFIVGGDNYGQGSSREHAALAPRYLGVRAVLAKSFARIHWQNLCNFGIVPLTFDKDADYEAIQPGDQLTMPGIREEIQRGENVTVVNTTRGSTLTMRHAMTPRQVQMVLAGSIIKMSRGSQQA
ncbi:Methanogen homoaconitase small subunit [compost metagenome]